MIILIRTSGIYITRKWDAQSYLGFWHKNDHQVPARKPDLEIVNNNNKTTKQNKNKKQTGICRIVEYAILADHRIKIKESEKREREVLRPCQRTKKHKKMKLTVIRIVISALRKDREREWNS